MYHITLLICCLQAIESNVTLPDADADAGADAAAVALGDSRGHLQGQTQAQAALPFPQQHHNH